MTIIERIETSWHPHDRIPQELGPEALRLLVDIVARTHGSKTRNQGEVLSNDADHPGRDRRVQASGGGHGPAADAAGGAGGPGRQRAPVRDFRAALAGPGPIQLIAEVKKASPSAGVIRADFDPVAIARTYQEHGAACISVLTDAPYFQGHLSYLARMRAAVAIPLVRKDFMIDEYQVVEARLAGADAMLLIAEILDDAALARLLLERARAGMAALVEFHDEANLPRVLAAGRRPGRHQQPRPAPLRHRAGTDAPAPRPDPGRGRPGQRERHPDPGRRRAARGGRRLGHPGRRDADAAADIGLAVERLLGLAPAEPDPA